MNGSVLAVIPARGGSKVVPRKNIRMLGGRPLIAWTIDAAKRCVGVDLVVVSTDDAEIAQAWGVDAPFMRSADLASDQAPRVAPLRHAVQLLPGHDVAVLLQPTSPFRSSQDIGACLSLAKPSRSAVSVVEVGKHPAWMFKLEGGGCPPSYRNRLLRPGVRTCRQPMD